MVLIPGDPAVWSALGTALLKCSSNSSSSASASPGQSWSLDRALDAGHAAIATAALLSAQTSSEPQAQGPATGSAKEAQEAAAAKAAAAKRQAVAGHWVVGQAHRALGKTQEAGHWLAKAKALDQGQQQTDPQPSQVDQRSFPGGAVDPLAEALEASREPRRRLREVLRDAADEATQQQGHETGGHETGGGPHGGSPAGASPSKKGGRLTPNPEQA